MRVENEIFATGFFWLPSDPDNKLPGILTIKDGGKSFLELMGVFDDSPKVWLNFFNSQLNDSTIRIYGNVKKIGMVTLDGCLNTGKSLSTTTHATTNYVANEAYLGAWIDDKEILFNGFHFSVDSLDQWLGLIGLTLMQNIETKEYTVQYSSPEVRNYDLHNGIQLSIAFEASVSKDVNALLKQKSVLKLNSEVPRPCEEFAALAYELATFIGFSLDSHVCIKEVRLLSDSFCQKLKNGKKYLIPIQYIYQSTLYLEKIHSAPSRDVLLSFTLFTKNSNMYLVRWFRLNQCLKPVFEMYSSVKAGAYRFHRDQFLAIAQALETFHRRVSAQQKQNKHQQGNNTNEEDKGLFASIPELKSGKKTCLSDRITDLLSHFKKYYSPNDQIEYLVRLFVDTRNYYTHYDEKLRKNAAEGEMLYWLTQKMEGVLQLLLLTCLGFSVELIDQIYQSNERLRRRLTCQISEELF